MTIEQAREQLLRKAFVSSQQLDALLADVSLVMQAIGAEREVTLSQQGTTNKYGIIRYGDRERWVTSWQERI